MSKKARRSPRQLSQAEITAAALRKTAHDLILQAEALEASAVADLPPKQKEDLSRWYDPISGEYKKIVFKEM